MFRCLLFLTACTILANSVIADSVDYGDLQGQGLLFSQITEISSSDNLPLYGAPSVAGNSLIFNNPNFSVNADANGQEFVDGRIAFSVTSTNGRLLTGITLNESGVFQLNGSNSEASINAIAFAVGGGVTYPAEFENVSQSESVSRWQNSLTIEFDQPLTSFSFDADNQLFALAGIDSSSFVDKQNISLTVSSIPEPAATTGLLFCGLLLLRRKRV